MRSAGAWVADCGRRRNAGGPKVAMNVEIHTIDEYITGFPEPVRTLLAQLRAAIRAAAPQAEEKLSYGIPTFYYRGNLVHFGAFKRHIGFFPAPSGIQAFKSELSPYKSAKGSVQFPFDEPLPLELVARIVKFRVDENSQERPGKTRR